jgi:pimeloyl-ACP methyl ester carboxylesterase
MPTYDRFFQRGDYRLFYRHTVIDSTRPTFVLLHGWSGNNTAFIPLVRLLTEMRINTVVPDLRGHGLSSKHRRRVEYRYEEFAEDLKLLLNKLNLPKVTIIGYSAGGAIALKHELLNPGHVDRLILIGSNHKNPMRYWGIKWLTRPAHGTIMALSKILKYDRRKNYKELDLVKINGYWASVYEGLRSMPMDLNLWLLASYAHINLGDLSAIKIPVLVVRGEGDHFFTQKEVDELVASLPKGKSITISGAGHYLVTRHEDKLHPVLKEFLNQQ